MVTAIRVNGMKGEPGTGYEPPAGKGPFRCGNCRYFRAADSSCGQRMMMERSRQPKQEDGRVKVDADGCCEYIDRQASVKREAFTEAARAKESK